MTQSLLHLTTAIAETQYSGGESIISFAQEKNNIKTIALHSLHFPNSIYNITSYNNNLYYRNAADVATATVQIAEGNYDFDALVVALEAAIDTETGLTLIEITADAITGKITFTSSSGTISIYDGVNSMHQLLGFADSSLPTTPGLTATADNIYDLTIRPVFLKTNINLKSKIYLPGANTVNGWLIPLSTFGSISTTLSTTGIEIREIEQEDSISSVVMSLVDEQNRPVSNNGVNFTATFVLNPIV